MKTIAITGVTGHIGGELAKILAHEGQSVRYLARRPEAAPYYPNASVHKASYEDTEESREAIKGADVLFMVSGKESKDRLKEHFAFIDAAKKAGVKHIIYTSFFNANLDSTFTLARDHAKTENYIIENGFNYTFLRDNFYLDFFLDLCQSNGEIRGPAADGRVSAVSRYDVAQVAAKVLLEPEKWENKIINLTGPQSLSMNDITQVVSHFEQKEIHYINETIEEAYQSRKSYQAEDWEYESWVSTYTAIANGELAQTTVDIETILGRKPLSIQELLLERQKKEAE
ncbi:hypothetical protein HMPREF9318_01101 [Streptococcus urinalis FB127-CNA-2]|uniref:NmrA family protein n=1 Tax=Streptococcus urinalis 2285-97 TaxID=764291 RepID=G5KHP4_9STRE|nr:SDR family oxidoreductase [Streptococcus urinalis]EHJ56433.1 NmrA family protein [Streptococcus urinalis 2285-97]EKS21147.1 hypothetical protein HMPREF9318_01101 [Streptococcus urinalis FB127-CNA-2]VEF31156.1 NmrA-like dehydrogenase/reductase [Streptococcus urinalis]